MRETRTSGLMSGEGKRSPLGPPRPSSTLLKLSETAHFAANFRGRGVGADIEAQVPSVRTSFRCVFRSVAGFSGVCAERSCQGRPCCHGLGFAQWAQVGIAPTDRAMRCQALA